MIRWRHRISLLFLCAVIFVMVINSSWFIKILYPYPHKELVIRYSAEYQSDPYLVLAIIRTESRFKERAYSRAGARGLMQIMPETGTWIAQQMKIQDYNEEMLYDPFYNIPMGIWYMAYLEERFQGNWPQILAAYNAGERKVDRWLTDGTWSGKLEDIEQIPYGETRRYVEKVLFDVRVYRWLYADHKE